MYHEKGLLLPAYIDPFSNYRYYVPKQVQIAQYIQLLREMDMPLTMIKQFLERVETEPQEAAHVLQTYLRLFDARVALVHQTARKVSQLLGKQENRMSTQTERELCLDDLPLVESSQLLDTLKKVLDVSASVLSPDNYRLVGTTASLLHGAHTPSKGIDFLMRDHESVDALHLALSVFKIDSPPTYLPSDRQYWATYFVDDVNVGASTVEWNAVSDGIECLGEGPWAHFSALPLGEHLVPTVALELRLVTELFRSRPDRYRPLIKYMRIRPCDIALLLRGMDERKIPKEKQEEVIGQLTYPEHCHNWESNE